LRIVSIAMSQAVRSFSQVYAGKQYSLTSARARTLMDDTQALLRHWIETILAEKKWSKARLAKEAGFPTSTITRLFREDYSGSMNMSSIAKIVRATGKPAPRNIGGVEAQEGLSEPQATPYSGAPERHLTEGQSIWTCHSNALAVMGLMPGDRFILDQNQSPKPRDIIAIQHYDHQTGTAETLIRVYMDEFAVTPTYIVDGTPRIHLNGTNASIMGVLIESWRTRS
jgi:AraC-like DNA-binding protein